MNDILGSKKIYEHPPSQEFVLFPNKQVSQLVSLENITTLISFNSLNIFEIVLHHSFRCLYVW